MQKHSRHHGDRQRHRPTIDARRRQRRGGRGHRQQRCATPASRYARCGRSRWTNWRRCWAHSTVDLVLAAHAVRPLLPLDEVAADREACGQDVPLLAVLDGIDRRHPGQRAGAGCAGRRPARPPAAAARRPCAPNGHDLEARRSQRQLEAQMRETERRCDALIDSSRDPIAYVHEGMHIRANEAYLEMFGFETFDDIEGMSLLDLVAPQHVDDFKQLLKRLSKGEAPPPSYELTARDIEGNGFPAVMEFTAATYEGEACQQVDLPSAGNRTGPGAGPRGRGTQASATRPPACSTARPSCRAGRRGGRCRSARIRARPAADRTRPLRQAAGRDRPGRRRRPDRRARRNDWTASAEGAMTARFGDHQLGGAGAQQRPCRDQGAGRAASVRRSPTTCWKSDDSSLNATVSIGGVQIGEKDRQHQPGPGQGQPGRGVRRSAWAATASSCSTPARWTAPRKSASRHGSRACATRWRTTPSASTTSR